MTSTQPTAELDSRFSSGEATPIPWADGRGSLEKAELYWLTTVRPNGRPHVTPVLSVWLDGALYFSTGERERKAKNLARNTQCVITTGCNALDQGLHVVVEDEATLVRDAARLQRVADGFASKYVPRTGAKVWRFGVREGLSPSTAAWPSSTKSSRQRPSASARASSARPAGSSTGGSLADGLRQATIRPLRLRPALGFSGPRLLRGAYAASLLSPDDGGRGFDLRCNRDRDEREGSTRRGSARKPDR